VRPHARDLLILGALPLFLVLFNDFWAFTGTQSPYLDPWFYVAYFLHLKSQLLAFPHVYFGDRVSYNVPGWLLYKLLGFWIGNYVFRLSIIYVALFSLYFAAARLFGRRAALFASSLLVVSPYFLIAFGWSYTDGPAIAYYALSLYLVVRAATGERWRLAMVGSGACAMLSVSTHFLYLNLIWTLPLAYLLLIWAERRERLWKGIAVFVAAMAVAFVACCAVYFIITGHWFYLANSVHHTLHGFKPAQQINQPVKTWIGDSYWLVHYNMISVLVLGLLFRRSTGRSERVCLTLFAATYITVWVWQFVGFPFTMVFWYTSFLFPVYLLALAAIFRDPLQRLGVGSFSALTALVLLFGSGLVLFAGRLGGILIMARGALEPNPAIRLSLIGIALCVASLVAWKRGLTGCALFAAGLVFVGSVQLSYVNYSGWFAPKPGSLYTNAQGYRMIVEADAWLDQQLPNRRVLHWYDNHEEAGPIFTGLSSLYIDEWSLLNRRLPSLDPQEFDKVAREGNVVLVSLDPRKIDSGIQTLRSANWEIAKRSDHTIRSAGLELHMALVSLEPTLLHRPGMQEFPAVLHPEAIQATGTARSSRRGDGIDFVTADRQWLYDGRLPLDFTPEPGQPALLKISVKVLRGDVNIGIRRVTDVFGAVRQLHPTSEYQSVVLDLGEDAIKKELIISNATFRDQPAELLINRIDVCTPADSSLGKRLRDFASHAKLQ
jgi:hypothetical protein